jgi:membrane-associated phospholipid phosphatase
MEMSGATYTAEAIRPRRATVVAAASGPAAPLGVAILCLLALALVWALASFVPAVHVRDAVALHDLTLLNRPRIESVANFMLHLLDPALFLLWGGALVAASLAQARPRVALAIVAVMGLAPLTAETLKPIMANAHASVGGTHIGPASWPSGHATAATALVLSAILVAPARLRPVVAGLGAAFTAIVGVALLILAWHMPSDVLGGYLVAALWMALAVAALRAADRRWPPGRSGVA